MARRVQPARRQEVKHAEDWQGRQTQPARRAMLSSLFSSTTIPVLEQVVNFTEARHGVLAGNIANLDTPGYRTRDLSPELFQQRLQKAIEAQHTRPSPTYGSAERYGP